MENFRHLRKQELIFQTLISTEYTYDELKRWTVIALREKLLNLDKENVTLFVNNVQKLDINAELQTCDRYVCDLLDELEGLDPTSVTFPRLRFTTVLGHYKRRLEILLEHHPDKSVEGAMRNLLDRVEEARNRVEQNQVCASRFGVAESVAPEHVDISVQGLNKINVNVDESTHELPIGNLSLANFKSPAMNFSLTSSVGQSSHTLPDSKEVDRYLDNITNSSVQTSSYKLDSDLYTKIDHPLKSFMKDVPHTDGTNIQVLIAFLQQTLKIKEMHLCTDKDLLILLLPKITGAMAQLVHTVIVGDASFDTFHYQCLRKFIPEQHYLQLVLTHCYRKQNCQESFSDFVQSITNFFKLLKFKISETELVKKILQNLTAETKTQVILAGVPTNLTELQETVILCNNDQMENTSGMGLNIGGNQTMGSQVNTQRRTQGTSFNSAQNLRRCFVCNSTKHIARNCDKQQKKLGGQGNRGIGEASFPELPERNTSKDEPLKTNKEQGSNENFQKKGRIGIIQKDQEKEVRSKRKARRGKAERKKFKQAQQTMIHNLIKPRRNRYIDIPHVKAKINTFPIISMIDCGATRSFISEELVRNLNVSESDIYSVDLSFKSASQHDIKIQQAVSLSVEIESHGFEAEFLISSDISNQIIFGIDIIYDQNIVLHVANNTMEIDGVKIQLCNSKGDNFHSFNTVQGNSGSKIAQPDLSHIEDKYVQSFQQLLAEYSDVVTTKIGRCDLVQYELEVTDESPITSSPYRLDPQRLKAMKEILDEMEKDGVIKKAITPYVSPAFLVAKAEGKGFRLVTNFKKLNSRLKRDNYPMMDINSFTDHLAGSQVYSKIDISQAYHQLPIHPNSQKYTGFITPLGTYVYLRHPQGLATSMASYNRLMDKLFEDIKYKYLISFADDLLIFSRNEEEHVQHVREVLDRLRQAGLTLNPSKVTLCSKEISYLGQMLTPEGATIDPARVKTLTNFPRPKNLKQLVRFIAGASFFRKFCPRFAEVAAPLNQLRKAKVKFTWGESQENSFNKIKEMLTDPVLLSFPRQCENKFILQSDASISGISACLLQEVEPGVRKPIAYASRALTDAEKKLSIFQLECGAFIFGLTHFRKYLEYVHFQVEVDNQALVYLLKNMDKSAKLHRWVLKIIHFDFSIRHISSETNALCDMLSRQFEELKNTYKTDEGNQILDYPQKEETPVLTSIQQKYAFPILFTDIKELQKEDKECQEIMQKLEKGETVQDFSLNKGTLLHTFRDVPELAGSDENEQHEVVSLATWIKKSEVVESFKCHEIKVNGYMYDSHLLVTDSHIYVLRDVSGRKGFAHIVVRRPLSSIVKITSKKKHPEVITFKYGSPDGESLVVSDMDRFLIPNASEATKLISEQIVKHLESKEEDG